MNMAMPTKPHIALVASPGMGHLIPVVELGKSLLTHHGFMVTVFAITTDSTTTTTRFRILDHTSALPDLNIVTLSPPHDISAKLGPNPSLVLQIGVTIMDCLPLLRSSILSLTPRPYALIVDLFGNLLFPMARDLAMPVYVFITCNAWFSALAVYVPVIDKQMELERHVMEHEPLRIPGCKAVPYEDTLEPLLYGRDGPDYEGYVKWAEDIITADGILVNTWQELEPEATKALIDRELLGGIPKGEVYFVGPLVRSMESNSQDHKELMTWLEEQVEESVVYVSFGSGGTLSGAQMTELAWGLELSGQRFVWVVRPPKEEDASGAFFNKDENNNEELLLEGYLPEGFLDRTQKVGRVVTMWAPQAEILGNRAVGGFVTHCGWNSTLESVRNGVGMVAWPLYAEQNMNARMLSEDVWVAIRLTPTTDGDCGVVGREEIASAVRRLMEGDEGKKIRRRVKELKLSGEKALSQFGTSYESLSQMTNHCLNHVHHPPPPL